MEYDAEINGEIRETLLSADTSQRFVLMNNGITIIANSLVPLPHQFTIEDFQIVNGCQTSHVLFDQRDKFDHDAVLVPIRLIVTNDESVKQSIIWATNRQTKVKDDEFFAHSEFGKKLEAFFKAYPPEVRLYYEHRLRQYDRTEVQRKRIITPKDTVRAFASMFLEEPHRTTRSYNQIKAKLGKEIYGREHKLDPYYVAAFALYRTEGLLKTIIPRNLRPAKFHILLAFRYLANPERPPRTNSREMDKYCQRVAEILWDQKRAEELFSQAAQAVEQASGGNLTRDNIRTQPFTDELISLCGGRSRREGNCDEQTE